MEKQFWICPECGNENPYPEVNCCDTCGFMITSEIIEELQKQEQERIRIEKEKERVKKEKESQRKREEEERIRAMERKKREEEAKAKRDAEMAALKFECEKRDNRYFKFLLFSLNSFKWLKRSLIILLCISVVSMILYGYLEHGLPNYTGSLYFDSVDCFGDLENDEMPVGSIVRIIQNQNDLWANLYYPIKSFFVKMTERFS